MDLEQWKEFKTWKEKVEELKEMIPLIYPQWTDYNVHDPGITLVELFAWLQQMQMYHIRQIGREHRREYLQLLGVRPVRLTPAHTFVTVRASGSVYLPSGTRFYAGGIPFENRVSQMVTEGAFLRFVTGGNGPEHFLCGDWLREGRGVSVFPFGREPQAGAFLEIWLDRPLKEGVCHRLYMEFAGESGVHRNPVDEAAYDGHGFYPLAEITMEYFGRNGWRPAGGGGRDGTYGFLQDGSIRFFLDKPMKEGDYRLRFTLTRCDYSLPPCITRISLAMVKVWQQETLKKEELPIYEGTGFPNQIFALDKAGIAAYALKLEGENAEAPTLKGEMAQSADPEKETLPWTQVEDFHRSGPEDRHYRLEEEGVLFGDGINGLAPEGGIRVVNMVCSLGDKGNIKSGTIDRVELPGDIALSHEMDAAGGRAREREEEAIARFRAEQEERWSGSDYRAVTFSDYEKLVLKTPGLMIEACKAYSLHPESREIVLAVKPRSTREKQRLTPGYERNLYRFLEEKRMIGTKLSIVSPDYYDVSIVCMICAKVQYRMAARTVEEEIRNWVGGKGFGEGISYGELLGMIDALPPVQQVHSLWLDGGSRGKRSLRGDLLLPPNGLIYLKKVTCNLMTPMRERL